MDSRVSNDADHSAINDMQARNGATTSSEERHVGAGSSTQTSEVPITSNNIDIKLPYDIPAHQVTDRSFIMMYHRFPLHIERAIYRLSHMKLTNPRRPLLQQVLLSNFMYAYLNLINYGYQQQQLAALEEQQVKTVSGSLEESQIEQLRQIESNNYEEGMYIHAQGAEEDSSSSSEDEESDVPNKRSHTSGNSKTIY